MWFAFRLVWVRHLLICYMGHNLHVHSFVINFIIIDLGNERRFADRRNKRRNVMYVCVMYIHIRQNHS